ncbi:AzlC family ABC transporter permease [Salaquimonas pukyongi]|uniref:AzlC family ABC transporter permease n=1 Tax=Salaquimonas pukyongi TaxID=2712698 RepID=UPI00096B9E4E|nr:AzlC family ABC transporter permease [Salaquimonas pukyongi]
MSQEQQVKTAETRNGGSREEILAALRDQAPLVFPVTAFGMIFGAASTAAGHSIAMTVWSSIAIFAGASQFVFLDVYRLGVPAWSVVLAVFAVNFRHILYSAAIGSKISHFPPLAKLAAFFLLTDLQFAVVEKRHENSAGRLVITLAYYFAFGLSGYLMWISATAVGALFGSLIEDPALIGLDFILPIYFLSILMGFRSRRNFLPVVVVSAVVAVAVEKTLGAPWHISIGALCGVATAILLSLSGGEKELTQAEGEGGSNG